MNNPNIPGPNPEAGERGVPPPKEAGPSEGLRVEEPPVQVKKAGEKPPAEAPAPSEPEILIEQEQPKQPLPRPTPVLRESDIREGPITLEGAAGLQDIVSEINQ